MTGLGRAGVVAAIVVAGAFVAGAAPGLDAGASVRGRAVIQPPVARLGEPVRYSGRAIVPAGTKFKWLPPEAGEAFTWGEPSARLRVSAGDGGRRRGARYDTLYVDAPLQIFRIGTVVVPGLRVQDQDPTHPVVYRLPSVRLEVASMLGAADSNADLRPVRGPAAAPWWERVPWRWVLAGALILAAVVARVIAWRRRRKGVATPAPATQDPVAEALAALAALRGLNLPAHGRYAEHAFHLSHIARRFLEATIQTPRPGYTTPELLRHLESTPLDREDLRRLERLLQMWDRVKFAREPSSPEEAASAEQGVETLARRRALKPIAGVA